jgi:hypothetical protein
MIELTDSRTSILNQRDVLPVAERTSWLSSPSMPGSCSALVQSFGAVKSQVGLPLLDDEDVLDEDDEDDEELDVLEDDVLDEALPDDDEDVSPLLVVSPPEPPPAPPPPVSSVPP